METKNKILQELQEIAPKLSKVEKKNSIPVPADYFSSFPEKMMMKIREQELAEAAPSLLQVEKINTQKVPANYFNSFPEQMLGKISEVQTGKTKLSSGWLDSLSAEFEKLAAVFFKPKFAFAIAGTASLVIVGVMFFVNLEQAQCAEGDLLCRLEKVSDEELDAYFLSNADDFQKSILDISTDGNQLQKRSEKIKTEINNSLPEIDEESLYDFYIN